MKRVIVFSLVAAVAALLTAPAFAQGKFDLKKESGADVQPLFAHAAQYIMLQPAKKTGAKDLPQGVSDAALYGTQKLGGQNMAVVVDGNNLYIASPEKLSVAKTLELPKPGLQPNAMITVNFGGGTLAVMLHRINGSGGGVYLMIHTAEAMAGTVQLAGKPYKVAVVDATLSGKWNETFSPAKTGPATSDIFAIDLNGNGKFEDAPEAGEIMPLGKVIQVAGIWYAIEVAADGSAVTFKKYEGDTGTVSVPGANLEMILASENGVCTVTGSASKFTVPSGKYTLAALVLSATDKDGAKWTLMGQPTSDMSTVKVTKGEATALKAGAPLLVKADATRAGQDVTIGCTILGQGGEKYAAGAFKDGTQLESPKFKIVDEAGKVLATDQFHYG